ncbi:hypothetical protein D1614_04290 [Maribellus luteus]|uniref:Uncharacterized protein n=1 Tax=Maribellus luteus TaxID=2305463 RepID=A0A399T4F1_9BACT|nr:hypothetical protein [Maribellus luteus]RIJ49969.1 hypothetical protein D1614_04290 [Maribellus luteus]
MNYQQEIQNCSKQSAACPACESRRVAVSSENSNLRLNFRHVCGEKSLHSFPFALGTASPQNLNAYEKNLRKMNPVEPKKEKQKRVQSLVFRARLNDSVGQVQSKYVYRAFFSLLSALCSVPFSLCPVVTPCTIKREVK